MEENIRRVTGKGDMRFVMEHIPHIRSCSIGVWITRGSRHEPGDKIGISHFLEHMVFKGTASRSAREIASSIESVGGSIDAFTGREFTCFHARMLDEYLELALDVLGDLIKSPTLMDEHIEREKNVIFEEIRNMEDTPEDLIHQLYSQAVWGESPLGYPLLGTYETVRAMNRADVLAYLENEYTAPRVVISIAGNIDFDRTTALLEEKFSFLAERAARSSVKECQWDVPGSNGDEAIDLHLERDCQQTHLCMGTVSFAHSDPRRYALLLLSSIMGGGMSSRLFQRVREEEALAYAVYSFQQFYTDTGLFGIYVGTEPRQRERAIEVVREEYAGVLDKGVEHDELEHAKNQLKGQLLIGLESTTTRMFRLANFEINREGYLPVDTVIRRIEGVGPADIADVGRVILDPDKLYTVSLGPANN